jgi:hypothetical protein
MRKERKGLARLGWVRARLELYVEEVRQEALRLEDGLTVSLSSTGLFYCLICLENWCCGAGIFTRAGTLTKDRSAE